MLRQLVDTHCTLDVSFESFIIAVDVEYDAIKPVPGESNIGPVL